MKIAFYAPLKPPTHPVPSGDRRMARLLMEALGAAGHEVRPACRFRSWDDGSRPGRQERLAALGRRMAPRLASRLRRDRPDLWFTYHLYHKAPDWLGPAVSAELRIPYVVAEASHAASKAEGPHALGHAAAAAALARADAVIALTSADMPGLRQVVAAPGRLVTLRPFVDALPYRRAREGRARHRADLARALDLPDMPWLLAVGMMRPGDKRRSYEVLAEALGRLGRNRDFALLVAGDGPERPAVAEALGRAVPPDRLRLLGMVDAERLALLYATADLLVWPAVNEAYGMALLEAQAAGLPVMAGRTGGVPDVVRDGVSGLLVPPGDGPAFASALAGLLDEPARLEALAAGTEIVGAEHDLTHAAAALDRILRQVSGAGP